MAKELSLPWLKRFWESLPALQKKYVPDGRSLESYAGYSSAYRWRENTKVRGHVDRFTCESSLVWWPSVKGGGDIHLEPLKLLSIPWRKLVAWEFWMWSSVGKQTVKTNLCYVGKQLGICPSVDCDQNHYFTNWFGGGYGVIGDGSVSFSLLTPGQILEN